MNENKYYVTKDLGCSAFLHANKCILNNVEKEDKLVKFIFEDYDKTSAMAKDYYNGGEVVGAAMWQSQRILKTLIHEGVRINGKD
jgi:hypothetical protein